MFYINQNDLQSARKFEFMSDIKKSSYIRKIKTSKKVLKLLLGLCTLFPLWCEYEVNNGLIYAAIEKGASNKDIETINQIILHHKQCHKQILENRI